MTYAEIKRLRTKLPKPKSRCDYKRMVEHACTCVLKPLIGCRFATGLEDRYIELAIAQLRLASAILDEGEEA